MGEASGSLFDPTVWTPALESYGAVTQLTLALCDADGHVVCGPAPRRPVGANTPGNVRRWTTTISAVKR